MSKKKYLPDTMPDRVADLLPLLRAEQASRRQRIKMAKQAIADLAEMKQELAEIDTIITALEGA